MPDSKTTCSACGKTSDIFVACGAKLVCGQCVTRVFFAGISARKKVDEEEFRKHRPNANP